MKRIIIGMLIPIFIFGGLASAFIYGENVKSLAQQYFAPDVVVLEMQLNVYEQQIHELYTQIWGLKNSLAEQDRVYEGKRKAWADTLRDYREQIQQVEDEKEALRKQLADELAEVWGNRELRDFDNMDELLMFIVEDQTDKMEYVLERGKTEYVCTHYTFQLMRNAADKGYRLYPVVIFSMQAYYIVGAHTMNFAVVGEGKYRDRMIVAIEPQTDEVVIIGSLYDQSTWISQWYRFLP